MRFDQAKADAYFAAVATRMVEVVRTTITQWDRAGLFR